MLWFHNFRCLVIDFSDYIQHMVVTHSSSVIKTAFWKQTSRIGHKCLEHSHVYPWLVEEPI